MTLTETAILTKRLMLLSAVFIFLAASGWFGYQYYLNYQLAKQPPPEIKPDAKFGLLPKPQLAPTLVSSSNFSYSIDTETGAFTEELPTLFKVYFIPQTGTTLLASAKARDLASSFNFLNGPELLSPTRYRFTDDQGGDLIIELNSGNFSFKKTATPPEDSSKDTIMADQAKLVQDFKNFLASKGLLKEELVNGPSKVIYANTSQKDSSTAVVSIWQDKIDGYLTITPSFNSGLIKAIVTKTLDEPEKYLSLDYTFWPVDLNTFSTYPIKTANEAFADLKKGLGTVVIEPKKPKVSLTSAYIAYLLPENYTPYLLPIFVFEGEQFAALVPAVKEEFLTE